MMMSASSRQHGSVKGEQNAVNHPGRGGWYLLGGGALALFLAAILVAGCGHSQSPARGEKTIEVDVTTPATGTVVDYQDFTGRLDAVKTIDIRARVSGYLKEIFFKEGDEVREGDLLFLIDPQPYQVDLNQAEANLKLAEADRNLQEKNAARAQLQWQLKVISKEELDTAMATAEKARESV